MIKILAFDSMYMVTPLKNLYVALIRRILHGKRTSNSSLVLYRLDEDNVLIREDQNASGISTGLRADNIDAMSFKFYQHLGKAGVCDSLMIKDLKLYDLYTRQVKLKLAGLLRCAYRIRKLSIMSEDVLEIITDRQTVSIMQETFSFLHFEASNIRWKPNGRLTWCVTVNSLLMRTAALLKMSTVPSDLPKDYFYKHNDSDYPNVLITMPTKRPEDFFLTYVKRLDDQFNITLYSMGVLDRTPQDYKRIKITQKPGILRGFFIAKNMCFSADSYISDILLIFNMHNNLNRSIDVVTSVFSNKIDAHISRLQTNVIDNYLAIVARKRGVFVLGDIMEELFYCDSAICSSASEDTELLRLSLANEGKITYKGSNSLMNYRLNGFSVKQNDYLRFLLGVDSSTKVIFYASDPSKDQSQRYLSEKFLISYFYDLKDYILVIKTHPQDNGEITNYAYLDFEEPSNIVLIGDVAKKNNIVSEHFIMFDDFDFNAALSSCDGFLTCSSSSILQALMLGVKTGVVDKFNNGNYDYLYKHKASMLIDTNESLTAFLEIKNLEVSNEILSYCGLKNDRDEFDVGRHLLECLTELGEDDRKQWSKIK